MKKLYLFLLIALGFNALCAQANYVVGRGLVEGWKDGERTGDYGVFLFFVAIMVVVVIYQLLKKR